MNRIFRKASESLAAVCAQSINNIRDQAKSPANGPFRRIPYAILCVVAVGLVHSARAKEPQNICRGSQILRVAVGRELYFIPSALQPKLAGIASSNWTGKILLKRGQIIGGSVVRPQFVYCQAVSDAPWVISGFSLSWEAIESAAETNGRWAALSKVHFIAIDPPVALPLHLDRAKASLSGHFFVERHKRRVDLQSIEPLVLGRKVFISAGVPSLLPARAYAFSTTQPSLSFDIDIDVANPDASVDAMRAVGDFVNHLKRQT